MTRLVMTSGRVGLTRMWTFLAAAVPLSVSPMIHRTVSPAATGPARLNTGGGIGLVDPLARIARLGRRPHAPKRLELTRQGQRLCNLHHLHGLRGLALQHGRPLIVVADLGRLEGCAAGERRGRK